MSGYGEVYIITSPSGKVYIGQAVLVLSRGEKWGTYKRWEDHIRDAYKENGGRCRKLNCAIRKYGPDKFTVVPILTTFEFNLGFYEDYFIVQYDSMNNDKGYNLRRGGRFGKLSEETRQLMSINRQIKPCFQKPHTLETKKKISKTLIDNVERFDHLNRKLPKYIKYVDWSDRCGYAIVSHPQCKLKYFVSAKKNNLDELLNKCMAFLNSLDEESIN